MLDSLVTDWMWRRVLGAPWNCQSEGVTYSQSFPWSVQAKPYLQLSQVAMTQPSCSNSDHSIREMGTGNWVSRWVRDIGLPTVWPVYWTLRLTFWDCFLSDECKGWGQSWYWRPNLLEVLWAGGGIWREGHYCLTLHFSWNESCYLLSRIAKMTFISISLLLRTYFTISFASFSVGDDFFWLVC